MLGGVIAIDGKNGEEQLHKGHRSRMKARFEKTGLDGFYDHEMLEFLLYYAIPRSDTNGIAHRLLNRFGSLAEVLDADIDELRKVDGIGNHAAVFLHLIREFSYVYHRDKERMQPDFSNFDAIGKYLVRYLSGLQNERLVAVFFTGAMKMIDLVTVSDGTVISADSSARKIAEYGFLKKAAFVVLAHNHPGGEPYPSPRDIAMTKEYCLLFEKMEMPLLEHYVIAGDTYATIIGMPTDRLTRERSICQSDIGTAGAQSKAAPHNSRLMP